MFPLVTEIFSILLPLIMDTFIMSYTLEKPCAAHRRMGDLIISLDKGLPNDLRAGITMKSDERRSCYVWIGPTSPARHNLDSFACLQPQRLRMTGQRQALRTTGIETKVLGLSEYLRFFRDFCG